MMRKEIEKKMIYAATILLAQQFSFLFCDFKNVIDGNLVGFTLNPGFYPSVSARLHRSWTGGRC